MSEACDGFYSSAADPSIFPATSCMTNMLASALSSIKKIRARIEMRRCWQWGYWYP